MGRKLLVVDVAALSRDAASRLPSELGLTFKPMASVFPALTCTAQATFRTARPPREHGMVGNGLYFRDLKKPMFWEQAAALVEGERIWAGFREAGGTVGMMFWQQSLGEAVDMVLSPRPIHKHGGGMVQDCYSLPGGLYDRLCGRVGRRFNLMHYWGPLASHKSSDWIVESIEAVLDMPETAPDLLLCYVPHLDYGLQKYGPTSAKMEKEIKRVGHYLRRLRAAASRGGYDYLFWGDYAIAPVTAGAVFPNRRLREAGLFRTRAVKGRAYPDFFSSPAFAVVDHEVAHVVTRDAAATRKARGLFEGMAGVAEVLDRVAQRERGLDHPRAGELVLVAEPGAWFAYPWWAARGEAPDYATHVDIHNKPGYDPCELFFGWPPGSVSLDTGRVRGSHGRAGAGRETAWCSSLAWPRAPRDLLDLAVRVKNWCAGDV